MRLKNDPASGAGRSVRERPGRWYREDQVRLCRVYVCVCVDYMYVRYVRQFTKGVAIVMHCVCWGEGG